jgi:hypothetical protein
MSDPAKVVFNLVVRLASVVFLATLVVGLVAGANPVIAAFRSMGAFLAFTCLGWAGAHLFSVPDAAEGTTVTDPDMASPMPAASSAHQALPGANPVEAARGGPAASGQKAQPPLTAQ